jgi:uncharacterized protein YutE (UPF0331/DUF86 family)
MLDREIIIAKASSVKRHLERVKKKANVDLQTFLGDLDCQEIILFNLQMAVQNCIDIAAHIISEEGFGVPGSNNEMFYLLEENQYLSTEITEKMVKAVGFRKLIVHEYTKIEIKQVYETARNDINDINNYLKEVFRKLDITE